MIFLSRLYSTYFLNNGVTTFNRQKPETFLKFRYHGRIFDSYYERKDRLFSKTADIVSHQIKEPILTTERFAQTDILLSQLSFALKTSNIAANYQAFEPILFDFLFAD